MAVHVFSRLQQKSITPTAINVKDIPSHSIPEVFIGDTVRLTEVTVEMLFPQMTQKVIVVKEVLVTELTQRMSLVRPVVCITHTPVTAKLRPIVELTIHGKQLQLTQKPDDFFSH